MGTVLDILDEAIAEAVGRARDRRRPVRRARRRPEPPGGRRVGPGRRPRVAGGEGGEIYAVTLDGAVTAVGLDRWLDARRRGRRARPRVRLRRGERRDRPLGSRRPTRSTTYARGVGGEDMDCPNVAAFGPDGALYVTCSGEAGRPEILRIAPGGDPVERWTDAVPGYPNGALVDAGRLGADRGRVARAAARSGRDRCRTEPRATSR